MQPRYQLKLTLTNNNPLQFASEEIVPSDDLISETKPVKIIESGRLFEHMKYYFFSAFNNDVDMNHCQFHKDAGRKDFKINGEAFGNAVNVNESKENIEKFENDFIEQLKNKNISEADAKLALSNLKNIHTQAWINCGLELLKVELFKCNLASGNNQNKTTVHLDLQDNEWRLHVEHKIHSFVNINGEDSFIFTRSCPLIIKYDATLPMLSESNIHSYQFMSFSIESDDQHAFELAKFVFQLDGNELTGEEYQAELNGRVQAANQASDNNLYRNLFLGGTAIALLTTGTVLTGGVLLGLTTAIVIVAAAALAAAILTGVVGGISFDYFTKNNRTFFSRAPKSGDPAAHSPFARLSQGLS